MPQSSIERWVDRCLPASPRKIQILNRRKARVFLLLLLCVVLSAQATTPSLEASPDESRVLPQLQHEAAASPNKRFRVIISRSNRDRQADKAVEAIGGDTTEEINAEAFVAMVPGRAIAALGRHAAVKYIAPDAVMLKAGMVNGSLLGTIHPRAIQADRLWSMGITGSGVGVAVIDTGIALGLREWNDAYGRTRVVASAKFRSNTTTLTDTHGHGTHVAGIIAGNSWYSDLIGIRGKYIGIAPEANLINVKVSDETGVSYMSDVVDAIEWVIANRQTYNIRVMNLSLISSVAESARTSILAAAVERAWFSGIFVVTASGNFGPNTMYYPPANDPFIVTVGAADSLGTVNPADDRVVPWSSYGTTQDGFGKPEVVAPGRYMTSVLAPSNSTLAKTFPYRMVDASYMWMSGTSMAAPVVSGVAALAFQVHPEWTNDQVKWLIQNTATPIYSAGQGRGLVNATALVYYSGTPGFANQQITVNHHLVGPNGATTYTGSSTASWSTASWSTASWSTASWSTASWSTANSSTATWTTATEIGIE